MFFAKNPILVTISNWFQRNFTDPGAISLVFILVGLLFMIELWGDTLAPILVSVIFAYLLDTPVQALQRLGVPRMLALGVIFALFVGLIILSLVWLVPLLGHEMVALADQLPTTFAQLQQQIIVWQHTYSSWVSQAQLDRWLGGFEGQLSTIAKSVVPFFVSKVTGVMSLVMYLVLVPLMVFFILKDRDEIIAWFKSYSPKEVGLTTQVWREVDAQLGRYIKGRAIEIAIMTLVAAITFDVLGVDYAVLLGVLVGASIIVPYVGAVIVTLPVVGVALYQWGLSMHFWYFVLAFAIIMIADGYVLVPLLFSGTMKLPPLVIMLSILIFGAIWGFWGIFFAIPLATLVKAILTAWPRNGAAVTK